MTPRRIAVTALGASLVPLVLGLVAVRPVAAAEPFYASYGLTGLAAGVRTAGDVGASGGLVTLDTGSGQVAARLDSSPSSGVLAAPYEPGTLFRTVVGQGNAGAGQTVFDVPDAEAAFPGTGSGAVGLVPPTSGGPLSGAGGSAVAAADATSAKGSSFGAAFGIDGVLTADGSTSAVELRVDPVKGTTTATARTSVGKVVVARVLELRDVVATASITSKGDTHTTEASVTVGGAAVSGMPVGLSDDGVEALGTPVLPGQTVRDATAQANAQLAAAGVQVRAIEAVRRSDRRSASVDTGGVVVTLASPELPGGVAANRLELVVGGVQLSELDELRTADAVLPPVVPPAAPATGAPSSSG
ncbi:MAG: hypothetical protein JWO60_1261, partial [Frankiales bacterium]|nr:hypothetical protein [Frankiales bacterium]